MLKNVCESSLTLFIVQAEMSSKSLWCKVYSCSYIPELHKIFQAMFSWQDQQDQAKKRYDEPERLTTAEDH
jgi:hypothetical protein